MWFELNGLNETFFCVAFMALKSKLLTFQRFLNDTFYCWSHSLRTCHTLTKSKWNHKAHFHTYKIATFVPNKSLHWNDLDFVFIFVFVFIWSIDDNSNGDGSNKIHTHIHILCESHINIQLNIYTLRCTSKCAQSNEKLVKRS